MNDDRHLLTQLLGFLLGWVLELGLLYKSLKDSSWQFVNLLRACYYRYIKAQAIDVAAYIVSKDISKARTCLIPYRLEKISRKNSSLYSASCLIFMFVHGSQRKQ